jgi:rhodanese-related sulfurtransferase
MKKFLTLLAAVVLGAVTLHAGEYPDISINELKTAIQQKKVTVIDANGSESYKSGHVPGAIDFQAEKADLASKLPSDKGALHECEAPFRRHHGLERRWRSAREVIPLRT